MKDKKVVFMGTPDFAVPVLENLIKETNVVLVVTQPDKPVGRHKELLFTPIKEVAIKNNIPVFQPIKIKEDYENVIESNPDIIITCAYGQIIPKKLLDYPKYGCINVHASLLPKLRGGAPLHKAIITGEKVTGITIMYMSEKMDAGDIIEQESTLITDADNVGTIHDRLSLMGSELLIKVLPSIFNGTNKRIKQNESDVTYAWNITREEEKIDFNKTSKEVFNQIRGLYPYPVAYTNLNNEVIKVTESFISNSEIGDCGEITNVGKDGITVKCKDKSIVITKLKPSGKKEMKAIDFINGYKKELLGEFFK
mgnify:FL=1